MKYKQNMSVLFEVLESQPKDSAYGSVFGRLSWGIVEPVARRLCTLVVHFVDLGHHHVVEVGWEAFDLSLVALLG